MGQEIDNIRFRKADFKTFTSRLQQETAILQGWFDENRFDSSPYVCGFELEAWLLDGALRPAPRNEEFLAQLDDQLLSPELANFNVEFNTPPMTLVGDTLSKMHHSFKQNWDQAQLVAREMGCELMMTGILPSLKESDLTIEHMSKMKRYQALNEQVLSQRKGKPLHLNINGKQSLNSEHLNVMLEAAATSFQLHLQIPQQQALRAYNAAIILSAPLLAAGTNSPFLFGKDLWDETRIPVFEQAVEAGGYGGASQGPVKRVSFGTGYARESLMECFTENLEHFPVLLPIIFDQPAETLSHLRLHNGTLWRWNRPLIGFNEQNQPHLRIEQRVLPAGPTVVDSIANAALFFGLAIALIHADQPPEQLISFSNARDNFYLAARHGLSANLTWLDGNKHPAHALLLETILPLARSGLSKLMLDESDINLYLGIIEQRINNKQTGSSWQRAFIEKHGTDWQQLTACYLQLQNSGDPVHRWDI